MQWQLEIRDGGVFGPNAPTAGAPHYAVFRSRREPSSVYPASPGWSRRKARNRSAPTGWGFSDDG